MVGQVLVGVGEYVEQKSCECIMDRPIPAGNRGKEQQPPRDDGDDDDDDEDNGAEE